MGQRFEVDAGRERVQERRGQGREKRRQRAGRGHGPLARGHAGERQGFADEKDEEDHESQDEGSVGIRPQREERGEGKVAPGPPLPQIEEEEHREGQEQEADDLGPESLDEGAAGQGREHRGQHRFLPVRESKEPDPDGEGAEARHRAGHGETHEGKVGVDEIEKRVVQPRVVGPGVALHGPGKDVLAKNAPVGHQKFPVAKMPAPVEVSVEIQEKREETSVHEEGEAPFGVDRPPAGIRQRGRVARARFGLARRRQSTRTRA